MILQKVLVAGRAASARKALSPTADILAVARRNKVVATPATKKLTTGEKICFSLVISCSIMAIPAWVTCHLREYGGAS